MCNYDEFPDDMTLGEARDKMADKLFNGESFDCALCTQRCKIYGRKINKTMAKALVTMFLAGAVYKFVHVPSLDGDTHEASQLSWWGLIEEDSNRRSDGGKAGYWKITEKGRQFLNKEITIAKHAKVYDGVVYGFDGDLINIDDALGSPFHYNELMNAQVQSAGIVKSPGSSGRSTLHSGHQGCASALACASSSGINSTYSALGNSCSPFW